MKKGKKTVIAMLLTIMFIFSINSSIRRSFDEEYNEANIGTYLEVCSIDESGNL